MYMKKNFLLIQVSLLGLLASSCAREELTPSHDDVPSGFEVVDFVAGPEDFTKTAISGDGDVKEVSWVKGDQITIFYDGGSTTAQASGNGMTATFRATVPSGKNLYAVYPSDAATFADNTLSVSVPAVQDGTFSLVHRAVSKMKTDGSVSTFYNATSFFKIVVNDATYTKLVVSALGTDEIDAPEICGKVAYTFDAYGNPTAGAVSEGGSKITVNLSGKGTYYVTMLPDAALAQGVLVECYKGAERVNSYYVNRNIQVPRSVVASFGDIVERAANLYVTVEGAGTKSGKDWANAMDKNGFVSLVGYDPDHTTALAKAAMLDGVKIYMGEGTYSYNVKIDLKCTQGSETINYTIDGGYYNGVKDAQNHPTVFSGNNDHAIFYVGENMNITFDDCQFVNAKGGSSNDAAVKLSSADAVITMNRCVFDHNTNSARSGALGIANGYAYLNDCVFTNNTASEGAAFCVDNEGCGGEVVVNGGRFENNTATSYGGCISIFGGGPLTVDGATFANNSATNNGGVFSNQYGEVTTTFVDCDFNTNSAKHGGAVFTKTYSATFNNCRFDGNVANGTGTAQGDGGAVCVTSSSASDFNGCSFTNNRAANGGAVEIEGSAVPEFKNYHSIKSTFSGNTATKGGAVYLIGASSTASITGADINTNTSTGDGGAIFVENGKVDLHACTVSGNKGVDGGAMCIVYGAKVTADQSCSFTSNTASGNGGVAYIERSGSKLTATNTTFSSNKATTGGGVVILKNTATADFDNCTFGGDSSTLGNTAANGGSIDILSGTVTATNNCVFQNNSATTIGGAVYVNGGASTFNSTGSRFVSNKATNKEGGAITVWAGGKANVAGGSFESNASKWGGAIELETNAQATVTGNTLFQSNTSSTNGGAIFCSDNSTLKVTGATFKQNASSYYGGAVFAKKNATLELTECNFVANHTPTSTYYGGAICMGEKKANATDGYIFVKINRCFFTGNYSYAGGAIAFNDTGAKLYMNACSFYKDYCTDITGGGATLYYGYGAECHMNNCTVLDGTYVKNAENATKCAWIFLNRAGKFTISNCTFIGDLRKTDGGAAQTVGGLVRFKNGPLTGKAINNIICPILATDNKAVSMATTKANLTCESYYTKRAGNRVETETEASAGDGWSSNSTDGAAMYGTTEYFGGLLMKVNVNGGYADNYWSWNGNLLKGSTTKPTLANVKSKIQASDADFYNWLALPEVDGLDKDQRGKARTTNVWPGAVNAQ